MVLNPFLGKISSWIDLDSEDETLRTDSETTLKQEIAWANHLSLQVYIILTIFFSAGSVLPLRSLFQE